MATARSGWVRAGTLALTAALLVSPGLDACAAPVTVLLQGEVTQEQFDPFDPLGARVVVGSPMHAFLNFDDAAADAAGDSGLGVYALVGGTWGVATVIGSVLFPTLHAVTVSVLDGAGTGPDEIALVASEGNFSGLNDAFVMTMLFVDPSGTALSGDTLTLPSTAVLARFAQRGFVYAGQYTDADTAFVQFEIQGRFSVPEPPGGLGLPWLAAAVVTLRGWRSTQPAPKSASHTPRSGP